MELSIIILTFAVVALGICCVLVSCESTRNKYRIRDLETEVEILKDRERINDRFVDELYDSVISNTNKINSLEERLNNK